MANTKSAAKRARVALRKRTNNRRTVNKARVIEKKFRSLVQEGKKDDAAKLLPELQASLDKAAKKNAIHPNKAARTKSRTSSLLK